MFSYSNYIYPSAGHVITGNLNVIPEARVRNIITKVLNIDFPLKLISLNVQRDPCFFK